MSDKEKAERERCEAAARAWWDDVLLPSVRAQVGSGIYDHLADLLLRERAQARAEALQEAAAVCRAGRRGESECMPCAAAIRSLIGKDDAK